MFGTDDKHYGKDVEEVLLTAEDLLQLHTLDDFAQIEDISLCTVCSDTCGWTSSEPTRPT